eukprot:g1814.t1
MSPTECLWYYCGELWILALTIADIVSDFLYFEELYNENQVPDGVAFAVLGFGLVGLVSFLIGLQTPFSSCGIAASILFEDVPIIITTTAIQAYLVGYDVREWHAVAIVSYIFSLFAMQQKAMKLGLAKDVDDVLNNRVAERHGEIGPCFCGANDLPRSGALLAVLYSVRRPTSGGCVAVQPDAAGGRDSKATTQKSDMDAFVVGKCKEGPGLVFKV